jgi:hypothetical protein
MRTYKFEEQQQFRQKWTYLIYMLLFSLLALFIYAGIEQIVFGRPFGAKPAPNAVLLLFTLFILSLLVLFYITKLETVITNEGVLFRWAPLQKSYNKFSWNEIERAEIISYGFVGYGLQLSSYGMIYNVSGDRGLRLHLKSGRKVVLGTQKPDELEDFLRQNDRLK